MVDEVKQEQEQEQERVMPKADLTQVLTQLAESVARLEARLTPQQKQLSGVPTPEELLDELEREVPKGREARPEQQQVPTVDWEELRDDPARLAEVILQQMEAAYFKPLLQRIELIRVKDEIRECQSRHSDFEEFKDQIFALGMKNPYLSLEEAYHLAKAGKQKPETKPETQQKPPPKGEKRGVTQSSTAQSPKTVREAAQQAAQEVLGE